MIVRALSLSFFISIWIASGAAAEDIAGARDHPLVPRYGGSEIIKYEQEAYTDYPLLLSPATGRDKFDRVRELEGQVTRIRYRGPEGRSTLEVFRNYEQALADAGFQQIFKCDRKGCGGRDFNLAISERSGDYGVFGDYEEEQRYLAARKQGEAGAGDAYVSLYVALNQAGGGPNRNRPMIMLDVIEMEAMEERMVVLAAEEIEGELSAQGYVDIYGVLFDHDKASLRADSEEQLTEISKTLKATTDQKYLLVGHTDSSGDYDYNMQLSRKRADAVVAALVNDYGVDSGQMKSVGVGMAAPVATNATAKGRARNRRVVLVKR